MDKLKELFQSWERAASGPCPRLEVHRAETAKRIGIIGLVSLCILCAGSVAGQTQIQLINATPLLDTDLNPMSPLDPGENNFNKRYMFDTASVPVFCVQGDTAKLIAPQAEGGGVLVDNFATVNGVNVCDLGMIPGQQGPGFVNCFSMPGDLSMLFSAIHTTGFVGVGMIDLPVGPGGIIPLGASTVVLDLWDVGIVYGNTSLILETTCATPLRMTGGGSVFDEGTRFTHGFTLSCLPGEGPNRLEIVWGNDIGRGRARGANRFHLEELLSADCTDDPDIDEQPPVASFDTFAGTGIGRLNGVPGAEIVFELTDAGEPGQRDTATFTITPPPGGGDIDVSGPLNRGNHQAHGN